MYCPHCGRELVDDAVFCVACGRSVSSTTRVTVSSQLTGPNYGIPALIFGVACWFFSFLWLWPISVVGAVLAIVFGSMGIRKRGRGLAVAGLALGGLFLFQVLVTACFGIALLSAVY